MASTFAVTRNHLVFGLCLPLAVLLGYLLAEPYASGSVMVFVIFFAVLIIPVLMRWYHPLLIFSWHLALQPVFLPGRPHIWVVMAAAGLFFAILNRSVDPGYRLTSVPSLTRPMITLLAVVVITAIATGGTGLRVFGSREMGGKSYVYLIAAIIGYFVISTRPIKSPRVALALFFLPGISYAFGQLASALGPGANFILDFFAGSNAPNQFYSDPGSDPSMHRLAGLMPASLCVFTWILSRYGATGVLNPRYPWRIAILLGVIVLGSFGGFRSALVLMGLIFFLLACLERMWRSRAFLILLGVGIVLGSGIVVFSKKLPFPIQRALSFLPIEVEPAARQMAEASTQWRVDMWRAVSVQIPDYLLLGKGYKFAGDDLFMLQESMQRGFSENWESSAAAGDYHNGPLSVIIPFGIWGVLAFGWLLYAGVRYLYTVYKNGSEQLRQINRFLLALFVARILFFMFVFGAFYVECYYFTGVLGLSVALNTAQDPEQDATEGSHEFENDPKQ